VDPVSSLVEQGSTSTSEDVRGSRPRERIGCPRTDVIAVGFGEMSSPPAPTAATPTIPRSDDGGGDDVSLIRWMLSLSPEERLAVLQGFADSAAELMNARRGT